MKSLFILLAVVLIVAAVVLYKNDRGTVAADDANFIPGAFPPTLSDTEYHANAWTRTDCRTCHEAGVQGAPKTLHKSVPPLAKEAKCRTCHVLIPGSEPIAVAK